MEEQQIQEKVSKGAFRAKLILEILGAPKEHIEETLRLVLKKLRDEKGVDVISGKVHPPKEQKELFATFADLNVLFEDFTTLTRICFDYMPSSIEIQEPEHFKLPATAITDFVADTLTALHQIDFKLKTANARADILERNSANLLKNFILLALKDGPKPMDSLATTVGIKAEQLAGFMKVFAAEGFIREHNGQWQKA